MSDWKFLLISILIVLVGCASDDNHHETSTNDHSGYYLQLVQTISKTPAINIDTQPVDSHKSIIGLILTILMVSLAIAQVIRLWILNDKDEKFKKFVKNLEHRISTESSEKLALSPIEQVKVFLDQFLGSGIISKNTLIVLLVTICLISSSLVLFVLQKDAKKKLLYPWELYGVSLSMSQSIYDDFGKDVKNKSAEIDRYTETIKARSRYLLSLNSSIWYAMYSIFYVLVISFASVILIVGCLAITRKIASEMLYAKGSFTLLGGAILLFAFFLLSMVIFITCLTILSLPAFWIFYDVPSMILSLGMKSSIFLFSFLLVLVMVVGTIFIFVSGWIKMILIIVFMPWLLFILFFLLESILFSINRPLQLISSAFLRHSLEWKTGPLDFVCAFLITLTLIVNVLYRLF
jgi:hypothetical protein